MKNNRPDEGSKTTHAKSRPRKTKNSNLPGLQPRELALKLFSDVLNAGHSFDEVRKKAFESKHAGALSSADKGFARLIAATVLRLKPVLETIIEKHLERALPNRYRKAQMILLSASAQLLILKTPAHAAINLAVEQARRSNTARHMAGLINAVLRKVAKSGPEMLAEIDIPKRAIPHWLWLRWVNTYGEPATRKIAAASLQEPSLDLTVRSDRDAWAKRLGASRLTTGSLRLKGGGRIEEMEGFGEGAWWVQDCAAALPARLFGDISGKTVADLCAAPGGKTAQLAAAGANVIAVDNDKARLQRVKQNLERLNLTANLVTADVITWNPERQFDFILLDAPCTATGTIRRHPDILHLKREEDIKALSNLQRKLLKAAFDLLSVKGVLVYCTCSLEPQEGENQIHEFLNAAPSAWVHPIVPKEAGIKSDWLSPQGFLRTLPFHDPQQQTDTALVQDGGGGMDGFFTARITKLS